MKDFIQHNKIALLHDNLNIFFSKTDFIQNTLERIRLVNHDVILITGNSDYGIYFIDDNIIIKDLNQNHLLSLNKENFPKNIKVWFAENNCTDLNFIKTLPLGIENDLDCHIKGQGVGWEHAKVKLEVLEIESDYADFDNINKDIYVNFSIESNEKIRGPILDFLKFNNFPIELRKLKYADYINKCKQHKAVVCPPGNGLDTHRFYEILSIKRVPIIIKVDNLTIYEDFYSLFPCIIVDKIEDIVKPEIKSLIDQKLECFNDEILTNTFWKNKILSYK